MAPLQKQLEGLGANKVLTYDELNDKSLREKIKEWTNGKVLSCRNPSLFISIICVQGYPSGLKLCRRRFYYSHGQTSWTRRTPGFLWRHVKAAAFTADLSSHIQESHFPWILAIKLDSNALTSREGTANREPSRNDERRKGA
jgi:hypothetical protein